MHTREIPQDQWIPFFNDFSRQHYGEPVTLELLGQEFGNQPEAQDLPLQGITLDTHSPEQFRIEVIAGDTPDAYVTHEIASPTRVQVAQSEDGVDRALQIESADGPVTLVNFGPFEGPSTFGRS